MQPRSHAATQPRSRRTASCHSDAGALGHGGFTSNAAPWVDFSVPTGLDKGVRPDLDPIAAYLSIFPSRDAGLRESRGGFPAGRCCRASPRCMIQPSRMSLVCACVPTELLSAWRASSPKIRYLMWVNHGSIFSVVNASHRCCCFSHRLHAATVLLG